MRVTPPTGSDHDQFAAELAAARELARQFISLGYHAAYGDRGGVEIRQDDATAILDILREHAAHNRTPSASR